MTRLIGYSVTPITEVKAPMTTDQLAPTSKLDQLRQMTDVVADTGDVDAIARLRPQDATTNPSLLLKAAALPRFSDTMAQIKADTRDGSDACDLLAVAVGCEILTCIPGRISTEVDARLSFDTDKTVAKARKLIALYADRGIGAERILIKIAATWEGIRAGEILEREGINCNLTLLFGFSQAQACADAGVYLISPFVGRILDWYKTHTELVVRVPSDDPGVQSVTRIYNYFKEHNYKTVVMGASFRNASQVEALAGCDRLTISPELLDTLAADFGPLVKQLAPAAASIAQPPGLGESAFRYALNEDPMATEKLADGIRRFAADQVLLEKRFTG